MSGQPTDCATCAQCQRRFRSAVPRLWCRKYHQPALARCIDYRTTRAPATLPVSRIPSLPN